MLHRLGVLNKLFIIFLDGTGMKHNSEETVLHRACLEKVPLKIIRMLLDAAPSMMITKEKPSELTPFHLACNFHSPTLVVQALLNANKKQAECMASDGTGGAHLPLHAACCNGALIDVIKELLVAYPTGALTTDENDKRLPLHLECMTRCESDVVCLLLDAYRSGVAKVDVKGRTALHYAFISKADKKALDILIKTFPGAMEIHDDNGCLPDMALVLVQEEDEEDESGD